MRRSAIDDVNQRTMRTPDAVAAYSWRDDLIPPEEAALEVIEDDVRGRPILDLGVGGGRTTGDLLRLSRDYVGVDSSAPMIAAARRRHPGVRFEHADARDLSFVRSGSKTLVVFSCNGLGMVGHEDRLAILREVHRVLEPGGAFLFSTHNRRGRDRAPAPFQLPELRLTRDPRRMLARALRFVRQALRRVVNRVRNLRHAERGPDYAIVNDAFHDYGVLLYYTTLEAQRAQLVEVGFRPRALAFDLAGQPAPDDCRDSTLTILAQKL